MIQLRSKETRCYTSLTIFFHCHVLGEVNACGKDSAKDGDVIDPKNHPRTRAREDGIGNRQSQATNHSQEHYRALLHCSYSLSVAFSYYGR